MRVRTKRKKTSDTLVKKKTKKKIVRKAKMTRKKKRSLLFNLCMFLLWVFLALVMVGGVFVWYCKATLPEFSKALYVERNHGVKILAEDGRELTSYGALFAEPVDVDKLPNHVYQAIIDTEDRRFFKHSGFDYIGFTRAMAVNVFKMRYAQGASTITQQLAKNLFLTREKSVKRKVQEFILAKWLEDNFSKKQILNIYLNRVFFGSGAYGLGTASKRFFDKEAKDLNLREAAILAGALKAPSKYNYLRNKELALERAEIVLSLMQRAGTISKSEKEMASGLPVGNENGGPITDIRYFGDYVMSELSDIVEDGDIDLYVRTTLDYDLQKKAGYVLRKHIRANEDKNVSQGALIVMDKTGAIKAMVGGVDYNKSQFNRATQALRQAGSSFKLFVYLRALEKGFSLDELLSDEPIKIANWEPQNYDKKFHGAVTLREAFAQSLNVATVDLATYLSLSDIVNTAKKLGISTQIKKEPSIILGASEVKLIDMATAYATVNNGGYMTFHYVVNEVKDTYGNFLYLYQASNDAKVLSDDVVSKMNELLREVVVKGTGKKAINVAGAKGKTGTSQNYRDAWFIGSTDKYTTAVWVGNDDDSPMIKVGGSSLPVEIWADLMK